MKNWEALQKHLVLWLLMLQTHPLTGRLGVRGATSPRQSPNDPDRCDNGRSVDGRCLCDPCWDGSQCLHYVDIYPPRFLIHAATVVLPVNASGSRAPPLQPGRSYKYKIMVQGVPEGEPKTDLQYDLLDLKVYVTEDHVKKIPWT
nr:uncharacterized protein LOC113819374 [Penaeus vannamei]